MNTNDRYLRNRPFLLILTTYKPRHGVHTEQKGWSSNSQNWDTFERVQVVDRVSDKHMTQSTVIIDIVNKKLVKNRFDNTEEEIVNHYIEKYKNEIEDAMRIWINKEAVKEANKLAKTS